MALRSTEGHFQWLVNSCDNCQLLELGKQFDQTDIKHSSVGSGFGFTTTQPVILPKYKFLPGEGKVPISQVCLQELPLNLCKVRGHLHLHLNWDALR